MKTEHTSEFALPRRVCWCSLICNLRPRSALHWGGPRNPRSPEIQKFKTSRNWKLNIPLDSLDQGEFRSARIFWKRQVLTPQNWPAKFGSGPSGSGSGFLVFWFSGPCWNLKLQFPGNPLVENLRWIYHWNPWEKAHLPVKVSFQNSKY
jgi:hypothetical protein